jgi:hypothetical protein
VGEEGGRTRERLDEQKQQQQQQLISFVLGIRKSKKRS